MYLKFKNIHKQSGLGLPSALFLILVLVILLATMNRLNEAGASASGREWLSQRAFYSAESAAQISAVYALNPEQTMLTCDANFISNQTFNVSGIGNCSMKVTCDVQVVDSQTYYTFTNEGQCGSGIDTATRIIQIRVSP